MSKPSVNVVIITYNQENFVKDTIESVINQSYRNISKIIIADDGSIDETPNIIRQYASNDSRIKPILAKKNKGIAYNMNRALKRVDGDYLSVLGGDDLMLQEKIEKQVNYLEKKLEVVACLHDMDVFESFTGKSLGKFSEIISYKKVKDNINIKSLFDPSVFSCPSSAMYRTEIIPVDGFDTRLKYLNDFLFDVDVLMKGNVGFIDEVLGKYRLHDSNITGSEEFQKTGFEDTLIGFSIIVSKYPELCFLVKKRKNAVYINKILMCIKNEDLKQAKNLSKVLISEGNYFKGLGAYFLSIILNKERVDKLYKNRKLLKIFLKFV